eukprot:7908762-Pyramimonas_sp.AAC.1
MPRSATELGADAAGVTLPASTAVARSPSCKMTNDVNSLGGNQWAHRLTRLLHELHLRRL